MNQSAPVVPDRRLSAVVGAVADSCGASGDGRSAVSETARISAAPQVEPAEGGLASALEAMLARKPKIQPAAAGKHPVAGWQVEDHASFDAELKERHAADGQPTLGHATSTASRREKSGVSGSPRWVDRAWLADGPALDDPGSAAAAVNPSPVTGARSAWVDKARSDRRRGTLKVAVSWLLAVLIGAGIIATAAGLLLIGSTLGSGTHRARLEIRQPVPLPNFVPAALRSP